MPLVSLHEKADIAQFLRRDVYLHLYSLGDLDDFFWPYTVWYGWAHLGEIKALALLYFGAPPPVLLALTDDLPPMQSLLAALLPLLPPEVYAHLTPGLEPILAQAYDLEPYGAHVKMAWRHRAAIETFDLEGIVNLTPADLPEVQAFYWASYPDNWFDARMLETGQYFGLRGENGLRAVAGIHVYSPTYRVAALGNITTHPEYRGQGYATRVTARLCQSLCQHVDHIGLNVKIGNLSALACYRKLGFEIVAPYGEYMLRAR